MMTAVQPTAGAAIHFMAMASGGRGGEGAGRRRDENPSAAGGRVLIVEDEALVAMSMEQALAEAGYDVLAIVDTESEAIAAAARLNPDIVLMDITLRRGSGLSAARAIRRGSQARLIFVTGTSDRGSEAEAAELGAAMIRKPFLAEGFAAQVRDITSGAR